MNEKRTEYVSSLTKNELIWHKLNSAIHRCAKGKDRKILKYIQAGSVAAAPCGACRELMVQLMPETYKQIEIMLDYENFRVVTLEEITPEWWI